MQKSFQTEQRLWWDTETDAGRKGRRRRDDPEERERETQGALKHRDISEMYRIWA